jgi:lipopolysaccharide transport system permease protein
MPGIIKTMLMFLSTVFFPIFALATKYQVSLQLNPFTFIIEESRRLLVFGQLPDWYGLARYICLSAAIGWLSVWWVQKTRKGFASVL